ncbi:MAG: SPOR domain-containing protein [Gammaproteobacteria bacterium]|nr:SPOR domain-containing protein [Gammaproteobacteria bacterium]
MVLAGAYLPDVFRDTVEQTLSLQHDQPREPVRFEFGARLRDAEVNADLGAYADDANPGTSAGMEYLIQAASFLSMDDAESLRAQLILIDLPVRTTAVQIADKPWYRVTVGPFPNQTKATRAMTRLHELNLDALLIKRVIQ